MSTEPMAGGTPSSVCCYTIDEGYLLPTLLSASQLRRSLARGVADVLVVCFESETAATRAAAEFCADEGIGFRTVPRRALDGNPMLCARFLLPRLLEPNYRDILYLDGDTQVAGSLAPLLAHPLDAGRILAVPDPMAVMIDSPRGPWPARRAYFRSIGIPDALQAGYVNSGVVRAARTDWDALSRECLDLCRREGARFTFQDQDALNLVVGARARLASFRWNFPPFFMNFGADREIDPRIVHFMSNPRPWQGAFAPWGRAWHAPYAALATGRPDLARALTPLRRARFYKYAAQQRLKRFLEVRTWGAPAVRARIGALEARAAV